MCGISGILSKSYKKSAKATQIAHLQAHRGPDHFGECAGEGFHLLHNRLTIIDLSERSHQPLEDENFVLVLKDENLFSDN